MFSTMYIAELNDLYMLKKRVIIDQLEQKETSFS